jgi:hypothetical protein
LVTSSASVDEVGLLSSAHSTTLKHRKLQMPHHCIYLLTPWSRVLLEKLTGSKLVKKFPALHGTQRFITTYTSACHSIYIFEMKCTVLNVWINLYPTNVENWASS